MKQFFQNPAKVSLFSFIATVIAAILQLTIPEKIAIVGGLIFLIFLLLNPLFGFIYSFFIKGKRKIIYIIVHLTCICTVSFFALTVILFRYFVPFAP